MIPTPADLRLLRRFDRENSWELAIHAAGHLVIADLHHDRGAPSLVDDHLDPVAHARVIVAAAVSDRRTRAAILFAGYAANELARDEYREPEDLTFCVDADDHDGVHLLALVEHLPDRAAERFLLDAAAQAADQVRARWEETAAFAAALHALERGAPVDLTDRLAHPLPA
jgi:hypothetical protein